MHNGRCRPTCCWVAYQNLLRLSDMFWIAARTCCCQIVYSDMSKCKLLTHFCVLKTSTSTHCKCHFQSSDRVTHFVLVVQTRPQKELPARVIRGPHGCFPHGSLAMSMNQVSWLQGLIHTLRASPETAQPHRGWPSGRTAVLLMCLPRARRPSARRYSLCEPVQKQRQPDHMTEMRRRASHIELSVRCAHSATPTHPRPPPRMQTWARRTSAHARAPTRPRDLWQRRTCSRPACRGDRRGVSTGQACRHNASQAVGLQAGNGAMSWPQVHGTSWLNCGCAAHA